MEKSTMLLLFLPEHPGGTKIVLKHAGKDVSDVFRMFHQANQVLKQHGDRLQIGILRGARDPTQKRKKSGSEKLGSGKSGKSGSENFGSEKSGSGKSEKSGSEKSGPEIFGSEIPFSEPQWYMGFESLYYKETHKKFREKIRNFVETQLVPRVREWEDAKDYPREIHEIAYKAGIYGANWPEEYGGTPPEDYDIFHELIYWDEIARSGSGGISAAVFFTIAIALPPILAEGSEFIKKKVARDVITGKKIIALAVTEATGGSDVANLETTAVRSGDHYIVTGSKKFITSGMKADFYVVAVRTGSPGMGGISLLLMEKDMPGIKLSRMPTQGWWPANTALIVFDDVRVPVQNLIGKENGGFLAIMVNFNHERWTAIAMAIRASRTCIEESIRYARMRKTFGKRLIDHQVIRHKIAEMSSRVDMAQTMLEYLCYQIKSGVSPFVIGGPIAILKVTVSRTMEFCAREASQILGGNSYIRSGHGEKVERIYREVRVVAIGGGSEEILTDLAMRMAKL